MAIRHVYDYLLNAAPEDFEVFQEKKDKGEKLTDEEQDVLDSQELMHDFLYRHKATEGDITEEQMTAIMSVDAFHQFTEEAGQKMADDL